MTATFHDGRGIWALSDHRDLRTSVGVILPPSRFIIVDDGEEDALILAHMLERCGATGATVCQSGKSGLEALMAIGADESNGVATAAFINARLAGPNGLDLLKVIRNHPHLRSLVVVLLSASDEPRNLGKAIQLGADCYMIKFPSTTVMRELVAAIHKAAAAPLPRPVLPIAGNLLLAVKSQ